MAKTARKIIEFLILGYLALFPFGQLLRWEIALKGSVIPIHPTDFLVGLIFALSLLANFKTPALFKHIRNFFFVAGFSLLLSVVVFQVPESFLGGLYFLRLTAYSSLFLAVLNISASKKRWLGLLLGLSAAVGAFGWFQYFFYPDLRALSAWGWDDHFLRMTGPFLDPTFTGILLVFGFIISLVCYLKNKRKRFLGLCLFFLISVAFTYARAAYLGLIAGAMTVFFLKRNWKLALVAIITFSGVILALPRGESEGVKLERAYSIYLRFVNYSQTATVISKSPLFGAGFNNLCLAKTFYLGPQDPLSHSCSGSDSGPLFILATTGILGFLVFLKMIKEIVKSLRRDIYSFAFLGSGVALGVHGLFTNSYFYPWVMGFMAILLGISLKKS